MKWLAPIALCVLGCTAPEPSLELDAPDVDAQAFGGYAAEPDERAVEVAPPDPSTQPRARPRADAYWWVMDDPRAWIGEKTGSDGCRGEFTALPAMTRDGETLVLGLGSSPVADGHEAVVRFHRVHDGTVEREVELLRPSEWTRLTEREDGMAKVRRRYCDRLAVLEGELRTIGAEAMPVVGAWGNPIRNRLPSDAWPWPYVVSDGATREVDMAVTDIVIARADVADPKLELVAGKERRCRGEFGRFAKVWATARIAVYTRGACGC
jgi:hypothetical protein